MSLSFLEQTRADLEPMLSVALGDSSDIPTKLLEALRYSSLDGGKRIRPALVLASGRCCAVEDAQLHALMVAVELLHCFSLVHDDLPCMDDDDLRRGRASTHVRYSESTALLAGDALMMVAFEHVLACTKMKAAHKIRALSELTRAVGPAGMIGGQFLDMQYMGRQLDARTLSDMHRRKTGALIQCCCVLPTLLLDEGLTDTQNYHQRLRQFGLDLGVGFQIVDDIIDETLSSDDLGKPAGSDQSQGHFTYTSLLGVEGARLEAERRRENVMSVVADLGDRASALAELAALVFDRIRPPGTPESSAL